MNIRGLRQIIGEIVRPLSPIADSQRGVGSRTKSDARRNATNVIANILGRLVEFADVEIDVVKSGKKRQRCVRHIEKRATQESIISLKIKAALTFSEKIVVDMIRRNVD